MNSLQDKNISESIRISGCYDRLIDEYVENFSLLLSGLKESEVKTPLDLIIPLYFCNNGIYGDKYWKEMEGVCLDLYNELVQEKLSDVTDLPF